MIGTDFVPLPDKITAAFLANMKALEKKVFYFFGVTASNESKQNMWVAVKTVSFFISLLFRIGSSGSRSCTELSNDLIATGL